jgi:hypothetical protein
MTDHAQCAAYLERQADETDNEALARALRVRAEREREQVTPGQTLATFVAGLYDEAKARRDLGYDGPRERVERVPRAD